jgi:hypothetical protein
MRFPLPVQIRQLREMLQTIDAREIVEAWLPGSAGPRHAEEGWRDPDV